MPNSSQIVASDQNGPAPASTSSSPSSAAPAPAQSSAIPFVRASRKASLQDFTQTNLTLGALQQIGPFDIQSNGFLRGLELYVSASDAGNGATVAFAGNAPFTAVTNNQLQDPSSEFIINPYDGYELMIAEKYFALQGNPPYCDPRSSPNYVATTGAVGTGGSFAFELWVPLEDRERDAFCAVPNSAANKNYRYQAFLNSSTNIYTTPPTTLATNFNIQATNFYWTEPPPSIGNVPTVSTPNGNGSVAFLDREVFTAVTNQTNPTLILKNVGRVFKNIAFILFSTGNARDNADWPNPTQVWVNNFPLYYKYTHTWLAQMSDRTGYGAAGQAFDTVGGLDTGVKVLYDLDSQPGQITNWGPADQYLASLPTTKIQVVGAFGGSAGSLVVLERTIKPSSGAAMYGGR